MSIYFLRFHPCEATVAWQSSTKHIETVIDSDNRDRCTLLWRNETRGAAAPRHVRRKTR